METHPTTAPSGTRAHEIGVSNHVVKVIEVLAESPHSWEDAAAIALREAKRSLRDIASIYITDLRAIVREGHITAYRVNAKVSFVVSDAPRIDLDATARTGEETMRYRNRDQGGEGGYRPSRSEPFPDYDDYGLHGDDRRQYRGRESYEQQNAGGEGGRSGMWANRNIAPDQRRDYDEPYRSNESEERGYRNLGQRHEFEGGGRGRPDYYVRWREEDRPARHDYERGRDRDGWQRQDDYRRQYADDYGRYPDDYSRTDYGSRGYPGRDFRDYESQYSGHSSYEDRGARGWQGRNDFRSGGESTWQGPTSHSRRNYDYGQRREDGRYDAQYGRDARVPERGRGPKGYKRSDDRIREDVCDRLSNQYDVDASDVEVTVSNGEVTLTGTVRDRDQKFRIEHVADGVGGVNEVHNQLRVRRELESQTAQPAASMRNGPSNQRHS